MADIFSSPRGVNVFKGQSASMFPKPKKSKLGSMALETKASNLSKILATLDKPGAAIRQAAINVHRGKPLGDKVLGIFKGSEDRPSGSEVIREFSGAGVPRTKTGRAAQAVAGFALEVLNPLDPLNWIGVGALSKGGKLLQKAGKLGGVAKGLQSGERHLLSARLPFTDKTIGLLPSGVSKSAGYFLEGAGKAAKAIPGVERTAKFFKPQFEKIRTFTNIAKAQAGLMGQRALLKSRANVMGRLAEKAEKQIAAGELMKINPTVAKHYEKLGLTPKQIVSAEIRRVREAPIAEISKGAEAPKYLKEFVGKIPTTGGTTRAIDSLVRARSGVLEELGKAKSKRGIEGEVKGFEPRPASEAFLDAMEKAGVPREKAERSIKEFTMQQVEAIARPEAFGVSQKNADKIRASFFGRILGKPLESNPQILDMFKRVDPKAASIYEDDAVKAFGKHIESSAKQISTADAVADIAKNPSFARTTKAAWGPNNDAIKVEIPAQFQELMRQQRMGGAKVNIGHMYMPPEVAHEFKNLMGIMTKTDEMQSVFSTAQAVMMPLTNLFKRITLLAPPGVLQYIFRNGMSNSVQSAMVGAVSGTGLKEALRSMPVLVKSADNPELFAKLTAGMGETGQYLREMKAGNLFNEGFSKELLDSGKKLNKAERAIGIGAFGKMNEHMESVFRAQHYITRRKQGWAPEAAIDDVRKYLYDYVGGLSPELQKMRAFVPFISWTSHNIPRMLEHIIQRPGRFAIPERVKQNIENTLGLDAQGNKPDERALDEYVKGDWHIRLGQRPDGKWSYWRLKGQIPMADLEDVTSIDKFVDMMLSGTTPYLKTPIENKFNKSFFFKTAGGDAAPIEDYEGQTGKFLGQDISRKNINILRNVRPLNVVNQYMSGTVTPERFAGFSTMPVDLQKSSDYARLAFQRRLSALKANRKRQLNRGASTREIDRLFKELQDKAYAP